LSRAAKIWIVALVFVCLIQAVWIGYRQIRGRWREFAGDTAVERGRAIAEQAGCFACHGPGGKSPIVNPGAAYGEVPDWSDGTWMLWSRDEVDLRAWIIEGHPPLRAPDRDALIRMPAYGRFLTPSEVDDLVRYVQAVARFGVLDDPLAQEGRELAWRMGCFGCHGPEGRGGVRNPGSYRGYIPGWDGDDWAELVRDDDEFRQWVRDGASDRLRGNPAARVFLDGQAIRMPAYRALLDETQLDALLAYVRWLRNDRHGDAAAR